MIAILVHGVIPKLAKLCLCESSFKQAQRVVTPIRAVLTAKTDPYTKEGVELLCFLPYIIGSKDKMCV